MSSRPVQCFVRALLGVLVVNTALVALKRIPFSPPAATPEENDGVSPNTSSSNVCCSHCGSIRVRRTVDYVKVTMEAPYLDPSYHSETLTRLGTDLDFDYSACPSDSFMLQDRSREPPLHLDCPTLFIVGARKGGTTSLYHYVSKHSDFEGTRLDRGPKSGETYFFSSKYTKEPWESYLNHFPSDDDLMTGEASVGYLVRCQTPQRLSESCGKQARVVVLLRNPVDRFVSNFLMRVRLQTTKIANTTSLSTLVKLHLDDYFHSALSKGIDVTKMDEQWQKLLCMFGPAENMVYEGLYYVHLMNWMCNFPRENIMILNSEEFYSKPSTILDQVVQFLGLKRLDKDTYDFITANVFNRGNYDTPDYQKLSISEKKNLIGAYQPFNEALMKLLGWQESALHWNK